MPRHIARVAFALTIVFLVLGVFLGVITLRTLGVWQLGGSVDPSSETMATVAAICLFAAMPCNATAFAASLWCWWHGTNKSVLILVVSGIGILLSVACGISLIP